MTVDAVGRTLARNRLFAGLDPDELGRLARECQVRGYAKDEVVFARGDRGSAMYVIGQGSVALTVGSADGAELVFAVLGPPDTFGELALLDGGRRVATATARRPSALVCVPRSAVVRLLGSRPAVGVALLSSLTAMVRRVDEQASDLVLLDLPARVAKFLLAAAQGRRAASAGGLVDVDIALTQSELASLVGGSRQQINRAIVALEAAGAVRRRGARIVAVRPDLLAAAE